MGTKRKRKPGGHGGFTLIELLMVMIILLLAVGIILNGMPAALNAYAKAIDYANAQTLLSTTMTRLRDELGTAQEIGSCDTNEIQFTNKYGNEIRIYKEYDEENNDDEENNEPKGLYLEYNFVPSVVPSEESAEAGGEKKIVSSPLASNGVTPRNIYTDFGSSEFDESNGILTIYNLRVKKDTEALAEEDKEILAETKEFKIRVLAKE